MTIADSIANSIPAPPTRGEKNCNPGNIVRDPAIRWEGALPSIDQTDHRFCQFYLPIYGIRALCRILLSYQRIDGCKTLAQVVGRYAPKTENDTQAYLNDIVERTGIIADSPVDFEQKSQLATVARAIIIHENGRCNYDSDIITRAAEMALT